ncbi:YggS family pyridoxal phosphate-dependent enzyme [Caloramator sp. E03]|uniref:YggS family pyridoxal phosphate-dependent enzyme n=1 Tax=Caloramator sp. E03 TaxID=2576307 RepID=UPI001110648D|nr:YggS family pyridoxal phosphate-dependent enzyme [Caloramator sp. E03]QCX32560.1 YggS family pyridoxal phosphate-dependent enzyme [Caloramator sp. E03]
MGMADNINSIKDRIEKAAKKVGRNPKDILLLAVSKTQSVDDIIKARDLGIKTFGENKVQEILAKYDYVKDVKWHLIGHLQRNKVKYIIDKVEMIHSLDSIELAEEINKRSEKKDIVMPVLIQINIGKEESKSGIYEEELGTFIEKLKGYKNILISGIMTIPPKTDNDDVTRNYFKRMKELFEGLKMIKGDNIDIKYLSMGMTGDFEIAIEEGANIVRIGTGIFGERKY